MTAPPRPLPRRSTPAVIAELRRLRAAATPGDWAYYEDGGGHAWVVPAARPGIAAAIAQPYSPGNERQDARLIVAAVNHLPALLAELDRREAEMARLRAELVESRRTSSCWKEELALANAECDQRRARADAATARGDRLAAELRAESALLRAWAKESREGGWSTHQVDPMLRRAQIIDAALAKETTP